MEKFCALLNNIKSKEKITLIQNDHIISNDKKVAETFHEFHSNVVKTLNISQNPNLISGAPETDPVLQSIEKFSKHPKHNIVHLLLNLKLKRNFLN